MNILNLTHETTEEQTRTLLLGNLLAFHEQRVVSDEAGSPARYHLAILWVFVGSTVKQVDTEDKKRSEATF